MFTNKIYDRWMKKNQLAKYSQLKDFLPEIRGKVLDVGMGPGWFEDFFGIESIGIDTDKNLKTSVVASGDNIPFRDETFDFALCLDTIHLLGGKDIGRVAKRGGFLLVTHFIREGGKETEKKLLNVFKEFKLLEKKIVGREERDLALLMRK